VVYCAGPHCNGAARAALRLARRGRPVKLMLGGVTGWLDEGFALARGHGASRRQGGGRQRTAGTDPLRNRTNELSARR
ncbi:rhodanese, partial [Burkholderia pseudomallei]